MPETTYAQQEVEDIVADHRDALNSLESKYKTACITVMQMGGGEIKRCPIFKTKKALEFARANAHCHNCKAFHFCENKI